MISFNEWLLKKESQEAPNLGPYKERVVDLFNKIGSLANDINKDRILQPKTKSSSITRLKAIGKIIVDDYKATQEPTSGKQPVYASSLGMGSRPFFGSKSTSQPTSISAPVQFGFGTGGGKRVLRSTKGFYDDAEED